MQQLGDELNRTLNKMHSRAVLLQDMKSVLHKAGPKDCSLKEVQHGSPASSFPVDHPAHRAETLFHTLQRIQMPLVAQIAG